MSVCSLGAFWTGWDMPDGGQFVRLNAGNAIVVVSMVVGFVVTSQVTSSEIAQQVKGISGNVSDLKDALKTVQDTLQQEITTQRVNNTSMTDQLTAHERWLQATERHLENDDARLSNVENEMKAIQYLDEQLLKRK